MTDAQVRVADGWIIAVGEFPDGTPAPTEIQVVTLTPEQEAAFFAPERGQRVLEPDGGIAIIPPDPTPGQVAAFETAEDAERLALVTERAQTDPAFAALADLTLRGKGA